MVNQNLWKIKGQHLKKIRSYIGLSQSEFSQWLFKYGITGHHSEPYDVKTIAAMENGRRNTPDKVIAAIRDNCLWEGEKINWSYLTGESDYITYSPKGIVEHTFDTIDQGNNDSKFESVEVEELANNPVNRFGLALYEVILPILGYSRQDIIDPVRFIKYMQENLKKIIDNYIELLSHDVD